MVSIGDVAFDVLFPFRRKIATWSAAYTLSVQHYLFAWIRHCKIMRGTEERKRSEGSTRGVKNRSDILLVDRAFIFISIMRRIGTALFRCARKNEHRVQTPTHTQHIPINSRTNQTLKSPLFPLSFSLSCPCSSLLYLPNFVSRHHL